MSIKIAIAKKKLNTPLPIYLSGYSRTDYANGIHDDLYANVLLIENQERKVAVVSCDLLGIYAGNYRPIVDDIKNRTKLDHLDVVISCVHSHSSPALRENEYNQNLDRMIEEVKVKIVEGILEAAENAMETQIGFNEILLEGVGANRRDSKVSANTILKTILFQQQDKQGIIVNFNCHPTLMGPANLLVSRDYQGNCMDRLSEKNYLPMFLQGACGDISTRFTRHAQTFEECDRLGTLLAEAAMKLAKQTTFEDADSFSYDEHIITLPKKDFHSKEHYEVKIKEYEKALEEKRGKIPASELRLYETALQGINVEYRTSLAQENIVTDIPCGILRLGSGVVVFVPFELFSKLADRIYTKSHAAHTLVVGYSFDGQGYLPDSESYPFGGYEVLSCRYAQGAGEILADKIVELIND